MYFVEIETDNGKIEYLNGVNQSSYRYHAAFTSRNIKFWRGATGLGRLIKSLFTYINHSKNSSSKFKIFRVDSVNNSLAGATFTELDKDALADELAMLTNKRIDNPESIFKIKRNGVFIDGRATVSGVKSRFGKIFYKGGSVRNYLSSSLRALNEYEVIEILMSEDGITPKSVKTYNAVDFYCKSPTCRKYYLNYRK